jgi:hypothetical protein
VVSLSCDYVVDPQLPADAKPLIPPSVYARWWAMVESCSGLKRPMREIDWYVTENALRNPKNGEDISAYYSQGSTRIVLAGDQVINGSIVRHEMLHSLTGVSGHPRSAFLQGCGGVVACSAACQSDAGPPATPDPATPTVTPSQLVVGTDVSPSTPGSSIDRGLFTFTITVRNPFRHPVLVEYSPRHASGPTIIYPYEIRATTNGSGVSSGDFAVDAGVMYFTAGETKRDVFDFAVVQGASTPIGAASIVGLPGLGVEGIGFAPGTYRFRGGYGDRMAPDLTVTLSP